VTHLQWKAKKQKQRQKETGKKPPNPKRRVSKEGKILRGEKWYSHRNLDGELPKDISGDPNKMMDVEFYLKNKPKVEEVKKDA